MGKVSISFRAGRDRPWRVRWYERIGSVLKERETTFECGLKAGYFRVAHASEADTHEELAMTATDRARWWRIRQDCALAKVEPEAVIAAGLAALRKVAPKSEPLETARGLWELDARDRQLRTATVRNIVSAVTGFARGREQAPVSDFTGADLIKWVGERYKSQASRDSRLAKLLTFFRWCAAAPRRWAAAASFENVKWEYKVLEDRKRVGFFTAAEAQAYLEAAADNVRPSIATALFLGVRPTELSRIWLGREIAGERYGFDEARGEWHLASEWAKTRTFRKLYALPDCWWYWWIKYRGALFCRDRRSKKHLGKLVPMNRKNFYLALETARRRAGLTKNPEDGLRHSFGTHGFHRSLDGKLRGVEWCISLMGHVGGFRVFDKRYNGRVGDIEAEAYFAIYPEGAACELKTKARIIATKPPEAKSGPKLNAFVAWRRKSTQDEPAAD